MKLPGLSAANLPLKQRARGFQPAQYLESLGLLHVAGGESLSDLEPWRTDTGPAKLLGYVPPSARATGDFLELVGCRIEMDTTSGQTYAGEVLDLSDSGRHLVLLDTARSKRMLVALSDILVVQVVKPADIPTATSRVTAISAGRNPAQEPARSNHGATRANHNHTQRGQHSGRARSASIARPVPSRDTEQGEWLPNALALAAGVGGFAWC